MSLIYFAFPSRTGAAMHSAQQKKAKYAETPQNEKREDIETTAKKGQKLGSNLRN